MKGGIIMLKTIIGSVIVVVACVIGICKGSLTIYDTNKKNGGE